MKLFDRPRRLRQSQTIRNLTQENEVTPSHLVAPLFLLPDDSAKIEIKTMPGINRLGRVETLEEIKELYNVGVKSFVLFPVIDESLKDSKASKALDKNFFYLQRAKEIKDLFPDVVLVSDVALDPYSSDGHDGLVKDGKILNDQTVEILAQMALNQAEAGFDIIAPSDMMDGRVGAIRNLLEVEGYSDTLIMSYTAKYASAFYGPFRDALDSTPKAGDKLTYQMSPANRKVAIREAILDASEGSDILMVKPAFSYLDIIRDLKENSILPISCYNVSGEYAMIKFAEAAGAIDGKKCRDEMLLSFRRAGADIILTYFAKEFATDFNA